MNYTKAFFDPEKLGGFSRIDGEEAYAYRLDPDKTEPRDLYIFDARTILALNVALSTRRPLLVSGEPGSGKTSLARFAAKALGWAFYKQVVTSRTQASDVLWSFDAVRRLNDAQAEEALLAKQYYVDPGALWWAFDPTSAAQRGLEPLAVPKYALSDEGGAAEAAVVLLDEIDKADPDVPNDLLEPLDVRQFTVRETGDPIVARRDTLLVLTTNGERDLPPAFLRRCVCFALPEPTVEWLAGIANRRYGAANDALHRDIATRVMTLREDAGRKGVRKPGTSEYLDAVEACQHLGALPDPTAWEHVSRMLLAKHEELAVPQPGRQAADAS